MELLGHKCMCHTLRNCQRALQRIPFTFSLAMRYMRCPNSEHPRHHLLLHLLILHILVGAKWNLSVDLVRVFLMTSSDEHHFMCLLPICTHALEEWLLKSIVNWSICLFMADFKRLYIFWTPVPYQISNLKIFSPIIRVVFIFLTVSFETQKF